MVTETDAELPAKTPKAVSVPLANDKPVALPLPAVPDPTIVPVVVDVPVAWPLDEASPKAAIEVELPVILPARLPAPVRVEVASMRIKDPSSLRTSSPSS